MKPIVEVDYGLASSYDDCIEINRKLNYNPTLKKKIIKHEEEHTNGFYSFKDILIDFQSKDSYFIESLKFCTQNPESFINFFPIMYSYHLKCWTYNLSAVIPFVFLGALNSIFWYFTLKLSFLFTGFTFFLTIFFLNIFFVGYTHWYLKKTKKLKKSRQI